MAIEIEIRGTWTVVHCRVCQTQGAVSWTEARQFVRTHSACVPPPIVQLPARTAESLSSTGTGTAGRTALFFSR